MADKAQLEAEFGHWIAVLSAVSPNTAVTYRCAVRSFLNALPVSGLEPSAVSAWVASLPTSGLKAYSIASRVSAARSFVKHLQERGLADRDALTLLKRPKMSLSAPGRFLDRDEMQVIINAAKEISPRHHAVCLLLVTTGMRADEVSKARWQDVYRDPEKRLGLLVHGKGSKDRELRLTGRLWELIVGLHGGKRSIDPKDTSPLIPTYWGTQPNRVCVWQWVKDAVNAAVVAGTLQKSTASTHFFRHGYASLGIVSGASLMTVSRNLGHASTETTEKFYLHLVTGLKDQVVDYLPVFA